MNYATNGALATTNTQVQINTTDINNLQTQIGNVQSNFVTTANNADNISNVNTGNVGIGTNTPSAKLDVNGNVKIGGNLMTGENASASGFASTAIGTNTTASGSKSIALGNGNTASGTFSVSMGGGYSIASGFASTTVGAINNAIGDFSIAMGLYNTSQSYAETSIGLYNTNYTPNSANAYNATDRLFVIGNGIDENNRGDAMIVLKNGNTTIKGTTTANSFVKAGGTSSQFLMADGSTSTASTIASSIVAPVAMPTIQIGNQLWSKNNLDVSFYRNGDEIPYVDNATTWAALTTGAWCYYNNDPANGEKYGKLYNWYAVNDSRGLAPQGWHIPSDAEWIILSTKLGGDAAAGGKMKTAGTTNWTTPNIGATNSSGFSGLPGGARNNVGAFLVIGDGGYWWSSSMEYSTANVWVRYLSYATSVVYSFSTTKTLGFSVRCLRD
jgi:uncharacterized protein (TIGR02145 family)